MKIDVCFLGEDFSFSGDIKEYISVSNLADSIHAKLKNSFISKLNKSDISFIETGDLIPEIKTQTDKFIQRLCKNGIYTHTVDEYISSNPAYSIIDDVNKAASKACCAFLAEEIESFQYGMQSAEAAALSQVTGSGISVFSNSILTLAATSAMECAILKDQFNKADAQYKRSIQNISDSGEQIRIAKENQYVKSTYIPQMDKALYLFSYALMDKYLKDMIEMGKFDASALENVDYDKSMGLLGNLKHIDDVDGIVLCIKQAFIACPFNPNVYLHAATTPAFDYDTYKASEYFGVEKQFVSDLKKNILLSNVQKLEDAIDLYDSFISAYSICTRTDRKTTLKTFTKAFHDEVVKKYSDMIEMSISSNRTVEALKSMKKKPIDEIGVEKCVTNMVKGIVSAANFNILINECGYSELLTEISPFCKDKVFKSKKEVDEYLISLIADEMKKIVTEEQLKKKEEQKAAEVEHNLTQKRNRLIRRINVIVFSCLLVFPIILSIVRSISFFEDINHITNSHIADVVDEAQRLLNRKLEYEVESIEIEKLNEGFLKATGKITIYDVTYDEYKYRISINTSLQGLGDDYYKYLLFDKYNQLWYEFEVHTVDRNGNDSIVERPYLDGKYFNIVTENVGFYLFYYAVVIALFLIVQKTHKVDE